MDFKEHARAHLRQRGTLNFEDVFESEAEKGNQRDWAKKENVCVRVSETEKKGDLMQLDLILQVLQCSDKTFMFQKGWTPKLSWKEAFQALDSDIMFILEIQKTKS